MRTEHSLASLLVVTFGLLIATAVCGERIGMAKEFISNAESVAQELLPCRLRTVDILGVDNFMIDVLRGDSWEPVAALQGYQATSSDGSSFKTQAVADRIPQHDGTNEAVRFDLDGTAASDASVTAELKARPDCVLIDWHIHYKGPATESGWNGSFGLIFLKEVTGVGCSSTIRFVYPMGAFPWEVKGDTPYRDFEWQVRRIKFEDGELVVLTSWYDPDWIYGNNVSRAGSFVAGLPKGTPVDVTYRMAFFMISKGAEIVPEELAARASGRPLSLRVESGKIGNLFEPGEQVTFTMRLRNVTAATKSAGFTWSVWDYYGKKVAEGEENLRLRAGEEKTIPVSIDYGKRGMLFLDARYNCDGMNWTVRSNFGILPGRGAKSVDPSSPFGLAGFICNPETYPDQVDRGTLLGLAQRIGVKWIRGGWFPLKDNITSQDEERVRKAVRDLHEHGILPYVQLGATLPEPGTIGAFKATLKNAVEHFKWVSNYIEVGNELNFSCSGKDYVERLLRPVSETIRSVDPKLKVMSMGLGGVSLDWLKEFEGAGGMELIDVLSIHPGAHPRAPEFWEGWRGWVFRPQVMDAARMCRKHGKALWITEAYAPTPPGRSGLDVRTSADYLVRTYVLSIANGVQVICWYQLQDGVWFAQRPNPDDAEYNFGLIYTDLTPKPGYVAYGVMTEQLAGAEYVGRINLGADDLYGIRFKRGDEFIDVLWSYREKHETDLAWWPPEQFKDASRRPGEPWQPRWRRPVSVRLPASRVVTAVDIMGNSVEYQPEEGFVTLPLTGSPVYVKGLGDLESTRHVWSD